jgi:putative cell wall-binding protein
VSLRRTLLAIVAVFVTLASSLVFAAPASAANLTVSGVISGTPAGGGTASALYGADVWFFIPGTLDSPARATTDSSGAYSVSLPPGQYTMRVTQPWWAWDSEATGWGQKWYGGSAFTSDATVIDLAASTVIDMTLDRAGSVSGTITDAGSALAKGYIYAYLVHPVSGALELINLQQASTSSGSYTLKGLPAGQYIFKYLDGSATPIYADQYWEESATVAGATKVALAGDEQKSGFSVDMEAWTIDVRRLAGADRFTTSVKISKDTFPDGASIVFLASGVNFPDALAAGPAASKLGGPVLLTAPDALPAAVSDEIERLAPDTVVIVGGTPSVSAAVASSVAALDVTVTRLAGTDRFATSRLVADYAFDESPYAFIATGLGFPDALSAGAAAAYYDAPVILVNGTASAPDAATVNLLETFGAVDLYVVGGAPSMSDSMVTALRGVSDSLTQLAGANRYATSSEVLRYIFIDSPSLYVATGANFPDALAGAAAAGAKGMALVITPPTCMFEATREQVSRIRVSEMILLGGSTTIDEDVRWSYC